MSRAATSIVTFGVYLISLGVALMIAPNPVLAIAGLPPTQEVWIRVAGFLAGAIGYYYLRAAREEARGFFRWTVHARLVVPLVFGAFVLLRFAGPSLLWFAVLDVAAATWTWLALRRDGRAT